MPEKQFFNLQEDKIVLFADIIGFSNAVIENENVTMEDKGGIIVNFGIIYDLFISKYNEQRQKELGVKLLWVSDSIIISSHKDNANCVFEILADVTNQLYCSGFSLRGAICTGKLYHENNIWGTSYIKSVQLESKVAVYPRVIISDEDYSHLILEDKTKNCIEDSEIKGFKQFNYFKYQIQSSIEDKIDISSFLGVYSNYIINSYRKATRPEHIVKYVWLAEKLSEAIHFFHTEIDAYLIDEEKYGTTDDGVQVVTDHTFYLKRLSTVKISR